MFLLILDLKLFRSLVKGKYSGAENFRQFLALQGNKLFT